MSTIPELLKHARELMSKAVENTRKEFSSIRTGKATTSLLDVVRVDAYGSVMPLNQVAMVAAPEPRMLTVQPFDKGLSQLIEKAIREANLGLNPISDGTLLRIPVPQLTADRRNELVKIAHKYAEQQKIAIRNVRRDGMELLKKLEKEHAMSEDDSRKSQTKVQELTDKVIKEIDQGLAQKEAEIKQV